MTPRERALEHIEAIRLRADHLDEPLRSELVAIAVTLGNMMACIAPKQQIDEYPLVEHPRSWDEALR